MNAEELLQTHHVFFIEIDHLQYAAVEHFYCSVTKWMSRYIRRPRSFRTNPRNPFVFRSASGLRACHGMARIILRNIAQPRNISVQRCLQSDLTIKLEFASHSWFAEGHWTCCARDFFFSKSAAAQSSRSAGL